VNTPKVLIAISVFLLLTSAVFGVLNGAKLRGLRGDVASAGAERQQLQRQRATMEKEMRARQANPAVQASKISVTDTQVAGAEAELIKAQTEKSDLMAKLHADETQITELQKQIEQLTKTPPNPNPGAPSVAELQAQLDAARKQVDDAEREKSFLSEKFQAPREQTRGPEVMVKRREPTFRGSIRGTVLAVNHAYNFVVLNLGNRQGVEANAEMLVVRADTLIGKIRISSVEAATAIGDILSSSLARGVQVQAGDTVIYAGSNS
jgi:hypothetical protein